MANLKSLKIKSKKFIFKAYGNDAEKNPARIVFSRFPLRGEMFATVDKKGLLEGVDMGLPKRELQAALADKILENFLSNLRAGLTDYRAFFHECVEGFEDFEFDGRKIITADEFWQIIPPDAAETIASEAYEYAIERDEFTMGNLSA